MNGPDLTEADNGDQPFRFVLREEKSPGEPETSVTVGLPGVSRPTPPANHRPNHHTITLGASFLIEIPAWHDDALCRDFDLNLFFPTRGEQAQPALDICGRCAVRVDCLAEALDDPTLDYGIRGGQTAAARKNARRHHADDPRGVPRETDTPTQDAALDVLCEPVFPHGHPSTPIPNP